MKIRIGMEVVVRMAQREYIEESADKSEEAKVIDKISSAKKKISI